MWNPAFLLLQSQRKPVWDVSSILPRVPMWSCVTLPKPPIILQVAQRGHVASEVTQHVKGHDSNLVLSSSTVRGKKEKERGPLLGKSPLSSAIVVAHSFSHSANIYWVWLCARWMIHIALLLSQNSWSSQVTPATDKDQTEVRWARLERGKKAELPGWMPEELKEPSLFFKMYPHNSKC